MKVTQDGVSFKHDSDGNGQEIFARLQDISKVQLSKQENSKLVAILIKARWFCPTVSKITHSPIFYLSVIRLFSALETSLLTLPLLALTLQGSSNFFSYPTNVRSSYRIVFAQSRRRDAVRDALYSVWTPDAAASANTSTDPVSPASCTARLPGQQNRSPACGQARARDTPVDVHSRHARPSSPYPASRRSFHPAAPVGPAAAAGRLCPGRAQPGGPRRGDCRSRSAPRRPRSARHACISRPSPGHVPGYRSVRPGRHTTAGRAQRAHTGPASAIDAPWRGRRVHLWEVPLLMRVRRPQT